MGGADGGWPRSRNEENPLPDKCRTQSNRVSPWMHRKSEKHVRAPPPTNVSHDEFLYFTCYEMLLAGRDSYCLK